MEFSDLNQQAKEVRELYEAYETQLYGRPWTTEEIGLGFVGDVGDLAKLLQAHEGVRKIENHEEKLAHELSDCLWSVLILADKCGVDLEAEFQKTMAELKDIVTSRLDPKTGEA